MNQFSILLLLFAASCADPKTNKSPGQTGWLQGSEDEKFETVAKHLRGFDIAMVETGYRYTELYWAGQDQNWKYASYQLDKIKTTIENAIERRPKRAETAQAFLQNAIPAMNATIAAQDTAEFNKGFTVFQSACRSCHIAENVPFIQSGTPPYRLSPLIFTKEQHP